MGQMIFVVIVPFLLLNAFVSQHAHAGTCGNGKAQFWEACDGPDLKGKSCAQIPGVKYKNGVLTCTKHCKLNTSGCFKPGPAAPFCGDGKVNALGEECDYNDLNGMTCHNLNPKFTEGNLTCKKRMCKFDTSDCHGCRNGIYEAKEQCDGLPVDPYAGPNVSCIDFGSYDGKVGCDAQACTFDFSKCIIPGDPYAKPPIPNQPADINLPKVGCGNWMVEAGETCDGLNVGGKSCKDLGYYGGKIGCNTDCKTYLKACYGNLLDPYGIPSDPDYVPTCGDGILDTTQGEVCDNAKVVPFYDYYPGKFLNLGGKTCKDVGYYGGMLKCSDDCKTFVKKGCFGNPSDPYGVPDDPDYVPVCGNGTLDKAQGELCDPPKNNPSYTSSTCAKLGFYGGITTCAANCQIDSSLCYGSIGDPYGGTQHCGDGKVDPGEACDGKVVVGCATLGYYSGDLLHKATCVGCKFFTASCKGWGNDPYGTPPGN